MSFPCVPTLHVVSRDDYSIWMSFPVVSSPTSHQLIVPICSSTSKLLLDNFPTIIFFICFNGQTYFRLLPCTNISHQWHNQRIFMTTFYILPKKNRDILTDNRWRNLWLKWKLKLWFPLGFSFEGAFFFITLVSNFYFYYFKH